MGTVAMVAGLTTIGLPALASEEITVSELLTRAEELASAEVVLEGELIGDYGFRDDGWMWTQLNDDVYARLPLLESGTPSGSNVGIGIRMPIDMGQKLDPPGGYRRHGPQVRVTGVWKYHDVDRQGESFLEVRTLEVIEPGRELSEDANWVTIALGLLLVAVAAAAYFIGRPE